MTVDISVRVFHGAPAATLGRGHDVSCNGMAVYTPVELALGSEIQVSFQLPYSRVRFGLKATVRNRNGFRYGIEFKELNSAERAEMERVTRVLTLTHGAAS